MKLHWSPKSPFVRKVMVVAHETGVADQLELVRTVTAMTQVNPAIMADNPLGKIPTLVLDSRRAIFDSLVICEYFDNLGSGARMFPTGEARLDALTRHALSQGLTEALILWRNELNRAPAQQLPQLLAAFEVKVNAALDRLERDAAAFSALPFDIGHAATGCALGYMDFRFSQIDWRSGRPALATWQASFDARPSAQATAIVDA